MPRRMLPDLAIVLTFLREGQGWSQTELGEASGIHPNLLNAYERGRKELNRSRLEHIISFMGLPPVIIDDNLERLAANRAAVRFSGSSGPGAPQRVIEEAIAGLRRLSTEFGRGVLTILAVAGEALQERAKAALLWETLEKYKPDQRTAVVEDNPKFRSWAFSELVAAKSIDMAPSSPGKPWSWPGWLSASPSSARATTCCARGPKATPGSTSPTPGARPTTSVAAVWPSTLRRSSGRPALLEIRDSSTRPWSIGLRRPSARRSAASPRP